MTKFEILPAVIRVRLRNYLLFDDEDVLGFDVEVGNVLDIWYQ